MRNTLNVSCVASLMIVFIMIYILFHIFDESLHVGIEGLINKKHNYNKSDVGACSANDSSTYHDCQIRNPSKKDYKQLIQTYPQYKLSPSVVHMHNSLCPQTYVTNHIKLRKAKKFRQYAGYTPNAYLGRTRYIFADKPLPTNPDFFVRNGGHFS